MNNDLISRSALLEWLTDPACHNLTSAIVRVVSAPSVDAVEVVRCKDCKKNPRFERKGKRTVWCRQWRSEVKETDFCSYGERREDG